MIYGISAVDTKEGYVEALFSLNMEWKDPSNYL